MYIKVYADTIFSNKTSVHSNTCAKILITSEGLVSGMPMKTKGDVYLKLKKICKEDRIPNLLVTDMAKKEMYGEWGRFFKRNLIKQRTTKPSSG